MTRENLIIFSTVLLVITIILIAYAVFSLGKNNVLEKLNEYKNKLDHFEQKEIANIYIDLMQQIQSSPNPEADLETNYILVLSGRGSYLKNPVDSPYVQDVEDDYERTSLGIEIAREIVAKKTNQALTNEDMLKYGPDIIYNGRPKHNEDLKASLSSGKLNYPSQKFIILDLPKDKLDTRGHFISIMESNLNLSGQNLGVVTSAFHAQRVMLTMLNIWSEKVSPKKINFYLTDRELIRPGIEEDLTGELSKIIEYIRKGDLKFIKQPVYIKMNSGAGVNLN